MGGTMSRTITLLRDYIAAKAADDILRWGMLSDHLDDTTLSQSDVSDVEFQDLIRQSSQQSAEIIYPFLKRSFEKNKSEAFENALLDLVKNSLNNEKTSAEGIALIIQLVREHPKLKQRLKNSANYFLIPKLWDDNELIEEYRYHSKLVDLAAGDKRNLEALIAHKHQNSPLALYIDAHQNLRSNEMSETDIATYQAAGGLMPFLFQRAIELHRNDTIRLLLARDPELGSGAIASVIKRLVDYQDSPPNPHLETLKILADAGAKLDSACIRETTLPTELSSQTTEVLRTPLEFAVRGGHLELLDFLANYPSKIGINTVYADGNTALSLRANHAFFGSGLKIVSKLLEIEHIDVTKPDHKPFHEVMSVGLHGLGITIYHKSTPKPILNESEINQLIRFMLSEFKAGDYTNVKLIPIPISFTKFLSKLSSSNIELTSLDVSKILSAATTQDDFAAIANYFEEKPIDPSLIELLFDSSTPANKSAEIFKHLSLAMQFKVVKQLFFLASMNDSVDKLQEVFFNRLSEFNFKQEQIDEMGIRGITERRNPAVKEKFERFFTPHFSEKAKYTLKAIKAAVSEPTEVEYIYDPLYVELFIDVMISENRYDRIDEVLLQHLDKISDSHKQALIRKALEKNDIELLKVCIKHQFPLNEPFIDGDYKDKTPLEAALLMKERERLISVLINSGQDININHEFSAKLKADDGTEAEFTLNPLAYAVFAAPHMAEQLLQRSDIDVTTSNNLAYYYAVFYGKFELANKIYQKDTSKVKLSTDQFNDVLSRENSEPIVDFLVQHGFDPIEGFLHFAKQGKWDFIHNQLGLAIPLSANIGFKFLLLAIEQGRFEEVEFLLTYAVSGDHNHSEALIKAVSSPSPNSKIVQALLDCKANAGVNQYSLPLKAFDQYCQTQDARYLDIVKMLIFNIHPDGNKQLFKDELEAYFTQLELSQQDNEVVRLDITHWIQASLTPVQSYVFRYLQMQDELKRRQGPNANETAMDASLTHRATLYFENTVKPGVKEQFDKVAGNSEMEKVANIERDIKGFILDEIAKNCQMAKKDDEQSQKMLSFIKTHREALIDGKDKTILKQMIGMTSNDDIAHLAWRAYDPNVTRDTVWEPLLCADYAGKSDRKASNDIRTRVAMYFLGKPDSNSFIGQLAGMERVLEHSNTNDTTDSFSCYPGCVGRVSRMGEQSNNFLQLPPSRHEKMLKFLEQHIYKQYSDKLKQLDEEQQENLFYGLTGLTPNTALDIMDDKFDQRFPSAWLAARKQFIQELGSIEDLQNQINALFAQENEPPLTPAERFNLEWELTNIGGSGRNASMIAAYEKMAPKQEVSQSTTIRPVTNPFSFSFIDTKLPPSHNMNKIRKYIEFEMLYPVMQTFFAKKQIPAETISEWLKSFIDEAAPKAGASEDLKEKFKGELDKFLQSDENLTSLSTDEKHLLKQSMFKASLENGISKSNAIDIAKKLANEILPPSTQNNEAQDKSLALLKKIAAALEKVCPEIQHEISTLVKSVAAVETSQESKSRPHEGQRLNR